jgi:hypothetical protein
MTLLAQASGALGCLYVKCSGIGMLDDATTRRFKASLFLATWLVAVFFSMAYMFSFWVHDLHSIYQILWPFSGSDPRVASLGEVLFLGAPALFIAVRIGKDYAPYAKSKAGFLDSLYLGLWYVAVIMSMLGCSNRYGCVLVFLLHAAFFSWLVRESKRHVITGN